MALDLEQQARLKGQVEDADLALALKSRDVDSLDWAEATVAFAVALSELADNEDDMSAFVHYRDAILAYQRALDVFRPHQHIKRRYLVTLDLVKAVRNFALREGGQNALLNLDMAMRHIDNLMLALSGADAAYDKAMLELEKGQLYRALAETDRQEKRPDHLKAAISILWKAAATLRAKEQFDQWAFALVGLGTCLNELVRFQNKDDALKGLETAIDAFKSVTAYCQPEREPRDWAFAHFELGRALMQSAILQEGDAAKQAASEAVNAFDEAARIGIDNIGRDSFIRLQSDLALALTFLAQRHEGAVEKELMERIVTIYEGLLVLLREKDDKIGLAITQGALGKTLSSLANLSEGKDNLSLREKAIAALRLSASDELKQARPLDWLGNFVELAAALHALANQLELVRKLAMLEEVAGLYDKALTHVSKEGDRMLWARLHQWQGLAFAHLGERDDSSRGLQRLKLAELGFRQALSAFSPVEDRADYCRLQSSLGHLLFTISQREDAGNPLSFLNGAAIAMEALLAAFDENAPESEVQFAKMQLGLIFWHKALYEDEMADHFIKAEQLLRGVLDAVNDPLEHLGVKGNLAQMLRDWGERDLSRKGLKHLREARTLFSEVLTFAINAHRNNDSDQAQVDIDTTDTAIAEHRRQQPWWKRPFMGY